MDGATKETYEKIRVKADFDKLMKNIKLFHEIRSEKKQVKPFIRIQMVKMKCLIQIFCCVIINGIVS